MKKLVIISIVAAMLLASSAAFAQPSQSHDVTVTIPNVLMIRIVNAPGNSTVQNPDAVSFDLAARLGGTGDDFLTSDDLEDVFAPDTGSLNWSDVRVFANRLGSWTVTVGLEDTSPEDNDPEYDFDWTKLSVLASGAGVGLGTFDMPAAGSETDFVRAGRANWLSLGFGPGDFRLELDGSEPAQSYSATITYSIAAP